MSSSGRGFSIESVCTVEKRSEDEEEEKKSWKKEFYGHDEKGARTAPLRSESHCHPDAISYCTISLCPNFRNTPFLLHSVPDCYCSTFFMNQLPPLYCTFLFLGWEDRMLLGSCTNIHCSSEVWRYGLHYASEKKWRYLKSLRVDVNVLRLRIHIA